MQIFCEELFGRGGSETVYALLGYAVRRVFGIEMPRVEKTRGGKPFFPDRTDIYFSLSHCRTHVLCAVSDVPVGVDIESPRRISERAVRYFCSPEELYALDPLEIWVLKESYIKLIDGALPLVRTLRFARDDSGRILTPSPEAYARIYSVSGCTAAVCASGREPPEAIELTGGADTKFFY